MIYTVLSARTRSLNSPYKAMQLAAKQSSSGNSPTNNLLIKHLGITDFESTCKAMQTFTANRQEDTPDEIWLTEHHPVYTLGLNRKGVRLPVDQTIPLVNTDRGGKITYHGPGQMIVYFLLDLKRYQMTIRRFVNVLENSIIQLLSNYGVTAIAKPDAPGVYVQNYNLPNTDLANAIYPEAKIASLGLRLKNNCCYHGLCLNINMDLKPFSAIDPCGYVGLKVTQTSDLAIFDNFDTLGESLLSILIPQLTHVKSYD